MSYTPGPLPFPPLCRDDTRHDEDYYTASQVESHTAAEVARAVAAERERWEGQHGRDSAELRRLCAERDGLRKEVQALRKLDKKRALFQAGRDSYETAAVAMNTDDEAWESFLKSNGITAPQRLQANP